MQLEVTGRNGLTPSLALKICFCFVRNEVLNIKHKRNMGCSVAVFAVAVATLGGLVFGYELGIISGALLQLQFQFQLSCVQQEALVSSLLIGAVLASFSGGWLIDRYGTTTSILLSNLLIISGSLILSVSVSFLMLIAGRVMVGFSMSVSSMSCCIFVSETVSPQHRGLMVTLYEVGVTVGILLAYAVNLVLSGAPEGWRYMFGLVVVPSLIQLVSIWVLPSQQATPRTRDPNKSGEDETRERTYTLMDLFQRRDNMRTRTAIGLGLVLFQQLTGQPNVLLYASTVFQSVGFQSDASAVSASLGLGLVKVIATLAAMLCADKVGRRPLLIGGCSIMAAGLMMIGFLSRYSELDVVRHCSSLLHHPSLADSANNTASAGRLDATELPHHTGTFNWIILFCMMATVAGFSVGFGPITWVVLSEIFPAEVRGRAFAFSSCFNWTANLIVTSSFLNVIDSVGLSGTFLSYGVIAVAAVVFTFLLLPETKGKTLQDIDRELRHRRFHPSAEFCSVFRRRRFSPRYQRVSWTSSSL